MKLTLQLPEPVGQELLGLPDRDVFVTSVVTKALEDRRRAARNAKPPAPPRTGRRLEPSELRELRAPSPKSRERELAWRSSHREELQARFADQWVVLEGQEIVAASPDAAQAVEQARRQGVALPYVFYVDRHRPGVAQLGL